MQRPEFGEREAEPMKLLIRQGHVLDPDTGRNGIYDILTEDGVIRTVAEHITTEADRVLSLIHI